MPAEDMEDQEQETDSEIILDNEVLDDQIENEELTAHDF